MPVTMERFPARTTTTLTPPTIPAVRRRLHPVTFHTSGFRASGGHDVRAATRRRLLGGGAAAGLAALLAACGGDGDGGTGGPWELTDDLGKTVSVDAPPERVIAYVSAAAALWDYGIRPVATFGPLRREDGTPDPQAGNIDVDAVESVGDVWGELNIDKLASLEPDLIITTTPDTATIPYWYIQEEVAAQVEQLAPIATLQFAVRPLRTSLEVFADLARSLSGDADAEVTDGLAEFERATGELEAFASEHAGLTVLAVSPTADNLYVGNPAGHSDLGYFTEAGVGVVAPDGDPDGDFWETLSWEQADKYPADVIMYDPRVSVGQLTPERLAEDKPTWARLPAVRANQVIPWRVEAPLSYAMYATVIDELIESLGGLEKII